MSDAGVLHLLLPAVPDSVGAARNEATRHALAAGFPDGELDRVRLAVSEAVTNAVLHAYAGPGSVHLRVEAEAWRVRVVVRDEGRGRAGADPATASGGFGLGLMRALADELRVEDAVPGTRVVLLFLASRRSR
ncbi:MAG: ATP-binding protein [Thermoleophilia bacterium]